MWAYAAPMQDCEVLVKVKIKENKKKNVSIFTVFKSSFGHDRSQETLHLFNVRRTYLMNPFYLLSANIFNASGRHDYHFN